MITAAKPTAAQASLAQLRDVVQATRATQAEVKTWGESINRYFNVDVQGAGEVATAAGEALLAERPDAALIAKELTKQGEQLHDLGLTLTTFPPGAVRSTPLGDALQGAITAALDSTLAAATKGAALLATPKH